LVKNVPRSVITPTATYAAARVKHLMLGSGMLSSQRHLRDSRLRMSLLLRRNGGKGAV
jgi:hypothetical protein